ncbi:MAG: helix-turn-helix transcriptional regulator [Lewinellaceae bacterium]|nr:helix-turn-helix transcriptional regulator [Lewinella sp.]MCB9282107.1 helix-turn-helix transcriptional regulator [Lewinellaceae bacterium]
MTWYSSQLQMIREQHYLKARTVGHLVKAKQFIDDRYCDPIDLRVIARAACLSRFHFTRLFKHCYGRTPHQYLTEKRIGLAKKLLADGATVAETCCRIGFDSPNSFSAKFRQYTGASPSEYRKKQYSIGPSAENAPILPRIKS